METKFIEATEASQFNWGKFMVGRFSNEEMRYRSEIEQGPLIGGQGWTPEHLLVVDLATGEGAIFKTGPRGSPANDLERHRVWVCPLFEPFLGWLYDQDVTDLAKLPGLVNLGEVPTALSGYRRSGRA